MRAFAASGYLLRDARLEIRMVYTGFLLVVLVGMAAGWIVMGRTGTKWEAKQKHGLLS